MSAILPRRCIYKFILAYSLSGKQFFLTRKRIACHIVKRGKQLFHLASNNSEVVLSSLAVVVSLLVIKLDFIAPTLISRPEGNHNTKIKVSFVYFYASVDNTEVAASIFRSFMRQFSYDI